MGFCRVRVSDHKFEQVVSLKSIRRAFGNGALWAGLGPDNSPLVTRHIGIEEIYALDVDLP